jgi:hypothetical protein
MFFASNTRDRFVVLDQRERVIEVVKQATPLLVLRGTPEPFGVIL